MWDTIPIDLSTRTLIGSDQTRQRGSSLVVWSNHWSSFVGIVHDLFLPICLETDNKKDRDIHIVTSDSLRSCTFVFR
jgi:hypothetical protein